MSRPWSRRSALQTLAVGSGALAFQAAWDREVRGLTLAGAEARAALAGPPRRLLILFNVNGIRWDHDLWSDWLVPGATETTFQLGPITAPLARHRERLTFFDGLIFGANTNWGNTHWAGIKTALTGAALVDRKSGAPEGNQDLNRPDGPSIEAFLGEQLGKVATPQWPSLQLNIAEPRGGSYISFDKNGQSLPIEREPWTPYQKLFGAVADDGNVKSDPKVLARLRLRKSVLDAVAGDLGPFARRLPPEDRARADAQLDAVRTLEKRIEAALAPAAPTCKRPALGPAPSFTDVARYPDVLRASTDLLVATLACDLTRFVACGWRVTPIAHTSQFAPIDSPNSEHAMSHDFLDEFVRLKAWYMGEVAYLLDRLSAIPEVTAGGQMGTMLDNTIVLWATEISTGHTHQRMPWMTAGGAGLGVRGGRCMKLPVIHKNQFPQRMDAGYPHARLFVSLARAMGLPTTQFGYPELGAGPMQGYRDADG